MTLRGEQVRADLQRYRRVRVPELSRDEDRVVPLRDEDARERVAKHVERDALEARAVSRLLENSRGQVAVPDGFPSRAAEDEIVPG